MYSVRQTPDERYYAVYREGQSKPVDCFPTEKRAEDYADYLREQGVDVAEQPEEDGPESEPEPREPPLAMSTYHSDPQLTAESKRNTQKEADSSEE